MVFRFGAQKVLLAHVLCLAQKVLQVQKVLLAQVLCF